MSLARSRRALALAVVLLLGAAIAPAATFAAAPDIREVTPTDITIDGSDADWTAADFLAPMFEAGNAAKPVLSNAYAQYDCGTGTLYIRVRTVANIAIIPSNSDNFVKLGNTNKAGRRQRRQQRHPARLRLRRHDRLGSLHAAGARQLPEPEHPR